MLFSRAERKADWPLHLWAVKEMLPYFFAAGHCNYARYATYYLHSMEKLPKKCSDDSWKGNMWCGINLGYGILYGVICHRNYIHAIWLWSKWHCWYYAATICFKTVGTHYAHMQSACPGRSRYGQRLYRKGGNDSQRRKTCANKIRCSRQAKHST